MQFNREEPPSMRNLFTALKQDTHASHTTLENTYPFSIYHDDNLFSVKAYQAVLFVMRNFHETAARAVHHAKQNSTQLEGIASMINSDAILTAISEDTHALHSMSNTSNITSNTQEENAHTEKSQLTDTGAFYKDTHPTFHNTLLSQCDIKQNIKQDTHAKKLLDCNFKSPTSQAIAAAYVWLGSSMGANIIAKRLAAKQKEIPTNYYQAMASCAKRWVSFKQDVDALLPILVLENSEVITNIIDDANAWFEYLIALGNQVQLPKALQEAN
ncbi:heme oxygenase-like domain-containing protein [Alteromonas mediterranea]|uniref:hypothetical protein n=1 Tax=Alteromonas mediterranea TaxID=314275 RepID=UPI000AD732C1|nr:hypothetical protein [Alteromonas mediterranea]